MEIEVYADIVFLVNWIMDFLILWVAGKIAHKDIRFKRIALSALMMSLMSCALVFVTAIRIYYNVFAALLIIMLGVFFAFKPYKLKDFLFIVLLSYISAFTLCGMGMALYYFINVTMPYMTGFFMPSFPIYLLLASTAAFYILIKLSLHWIEKLTVKKQTFLPVTIYYAEQFVSFNALVDTGNSLHDPISNAPVIIAEFGSIKDFLPEKLRLIFYENREGSLQDIIQQVQASNFSKRLRMIPFASLGKQNGMLLGFRPDKVEIVRENDVLTVQNVVIGIYNYKLSIDDAYQGLLSPEVISAVT